VTELLAVALGGAVGAVGRAGLAAAATARPTGDVPWGTIAANLIGSFLFGVILGRLDGTVAVLLGAGVMGGLTTFATSMGESLRLGRFRGARASIGYTLATLCGCLVAAALGLGLGR
jgi:CrcB protein